MLAALCESHTAESVSEYVCRVLYSLRLVVGYVEGFVLCLRARGGG